MRAYPYATLDVFTNRRFGGSQLAVVTDARGLRSEEMQLLAAEFNFSETTFVLPPDDARHTARVRIFNRSAEMPFAGHPNLGTAFILAQAGFGTDDVLLFEEVAGLVEIRMYRDASGTVTGGVIRAPQPLSIVAELPLADVAPCLGLSPDAMVTTTHGPTMASVGVQFILAEVSPAELSRAQPDLGAFRRLRDRHPGSDRYSIYTYAHDGSAQIRARMFAPLSGTWEDPATGSAAATLAAFLLSKAGTDRATWSIAQGAELGRPSALTVSAEQTPQGIRSTVGGSCVEVGRGWVTV